MMFKDKKVAVLGWGIDTEDIVPWLLGQGAKITIYDKKENLDVGYEGIEKVLGREDFGDLTKFDVIVRNPAVYRFRPEIVAAEEAGVVVSSKIKIFFDECRGKIIGVTGTKGKGTTSTLIYEMLKNGLPPGQQVFIGGNMGEKVFGFVDKVKAEDWVVLELSSFQVIDLQKSPHIAVILMTTVDHLDWHKNALEYVLAKANLARYQGEDDWVVANKDYPNSKLIGEMSQGHKVWVSKNELGFIKREDVRLKGEHNLENVSAAAAAAKLAGVKESVIVETLRNFKGLEHRLEEVATVNGVKYYDDSFSTVPATAIAAIESFMEPEILIMGGSDKGSDFTELGKEICEKKNIRAVILIGLMAGKIEEAIGKAGGDTKKIKIVKGLGSMQEMVNKAKELAQPGDVVVLSPAAASFDMFKNYKDRGDQFKEAVKLL